MATNSTYRDHCVVDESWLAAAVARPAEAQLKWHDKIETALDVVRRHVENLDRYVSSFPWARQRDAAAHIASYKTSFFENERRLRVVQARAEQGFDRLRGLLAGAARDLRARSLHTYTGAAALVLLRSLQRFEGALIAPTDARVVRLFPDLPNLRQLRGPFVGIPFDDPVNRLAYGEEADSGFLYCRICRTSESDYEFAHLPRFEAEAWQDATPGTLPDHLYFGWVLPQWLLLQETDPPAREKWWISVVADESGQERYTKWQETPWHHERRPLKSDYLWRDDFAHAWLGDGRVMPVWTMGTAQAPVRTARKVFVSYSHEDRRWMEEITRHLRPAMLEGLLTVFTDRDIADGEEWRTRLERELREARVAILLVTMNFLSSSFIKEHEVPLLLEQREKGGLDLRPILVDHIDFGVTKWTSALQFRKFEGDFPLADLDERARQRALVQLATEIREVIERG